MTAVLVAMASVVCFSGCAGPQPVVFDKASIARVRKLIIVPMQTSQDPSTGPIVSELAAERLKMQMASHKDFAILLSPSLWRLKRGSAASPTDQQAVELARKAGAQAVLTGMVGYSVKLSNVTNLPSQAAAGKGVNFAESFALRSGEGSLRLRMLRADDGRTIYDHTADAKGQTNDQTLSEALAKAIGPLETYLKSRK